MKHSNDHYALSVRGSGLIRLRVGDVELMDRGLLNEVNDRSHWGAEFTEFRKHNDPKKRDPETGFRNRALFNDRYKNDHHYLQHLGQHYCYRDDSGIWIKGILGTRTDRRGAIEYSNLIQADDSPLIHLHIERRYLHSMSRGGDCSLCFLSPGGFAQRFSCYGESGDYGIRRDKMDWEDPPKAAHDACIGDNGIIYTHIPTRCRVRTKSDPVWGCLMGAMTGFGLIVVSWTVGNTNTGAVDVEGELRCTRPRPPAENKFDEIEFQFQRNGPREIGDFEHGHFILMPCRSWEQVHEVFCDV
jgi:hypothetical protein